MSNKYPSLIASLFPRKADSPLLKAVERLNTSQFRSMTSRQRFRKVNETLIHCIQEEEEPAFLLPGLVAAIDKVNTLKLLDEAYHIIQFEFWLNHHSGLPAEENYKTRAKISGKHIPREDYQLFFPIGMGKTFSGTHYVAAHLSPDLDTTIASFWGWLDAFSARVGDGLHIWNLPGGPPESPVSRMMTDCFGEAFFSGVSRGAYNLTLTSTDMLNQNNLLKESFDAKISSFDHGFNAKAIVLVDENGHYVGDWRSQDVEPVRQIIILFKALLHWFETYIQTRLIGFFSNKNVKKSDQPKLLNSIYDMIVAESDTVKEFSDKQREDCDLLLREVFGLKEGIQANFRKFVEALEKVGIDELKGFRHELETFHAANLFDKTGKLIEDRPLLFSTLQKLMHLLNKAIHKARDYIECLGVVIKIKSKVLGKGLHYLSLSTEVEDILLKMGSYQYLTVALPEEKKKLFPLGVVWADDIRKHTLGTVSLRDFCNLEEVKMAPYLSIISVIDHHKSSLKTNTPPIALIGDAQSCNVLVAEISFEVNKPYSTAGMNAKEIESQIKAMSRKATTPETIRLSQKLLQRKLASKAPKPYFVHPLREMAENFFFLHAILDDTDLLQKVTNRDVECVAHLLNQLKTLAEGKESEVVTFDDIPRDDNFAKTAAKRILQQKDMYELYRSIYGYKETEVEENLEACAKRKKSNVFEDTKEQNGCCRVGQTKLFSSNIALFEKNKEMIRKQWLKEAQAYYAEHPEIDLHIHMVSTIASAEEVYRDKTASYKHRDEMWFWIPSKEIAENHLASFLSAFRISQERLKNDFQLEVPDEDEQYTELFRHNFIPMKTGKSESKIPIAILTFNASTINSRKAMVSPFLPKMLA